MNDLAVEHRAALGLLYPIADALQMKLFLNALKGVVRIKGSFKMNLPLDKSGESIPFEIKILASAVGENEAWVLARVRYDLWMLMGYLKSNRELQFCVVDAMKAHIGPLTVETWSGESLATVSKHLGSGIVASYYRLKDESTWRSLDVATVDERQGGETAAGDRAATPEGEDTQPDS